MEDTPVLKIEVGGLGDSSVMFFVVDLGTGKISWFSLDKLL